MGTTSSSAPARTEEPAPVGVEDLVGDQDPERAGRRAQQPGPVAGHGVEGHGREVGEVGEEAPVGDVLAEGHPVDLLEGGHDAAVGTPGHDLVAEGGALTPARSPRPPGWRELRARADMVGGLRGCRPGGRPGEERSRPRARRPAAGCARVLALRSAEVAASWAEDGGRVDLLPRGPRRPPPCTAATRSRRRRPPPSGAAAPTTAQRHHDGAPAAGPGSRLPDRPADGGDRPARRARRRPATPRRSRSSGPPSRAVPSSGPPAWPRKTPPIGRPPNGQLIRTASSQGEGTGEGRQPAPWPAGPARRPRPWRAPRPPSGRARRTS